MSNRSILVVYANSIDVELTGSWKIVKDNITNESTLYLEAKYKDYKEVISSKRKWYFFWLHSDYTETRYVTFHEWLPEKHLKIIDTTTYENSCKEGKI